MSPGGLVGALLRLAGARLLGAFAGLRLAGLLAEPCPLLTVEPSIARPRLAGLLAGLHARPYIARLGLSSDRLRLVPFLRGRFCSNSNTGLFQSHILYNRIEQGNA